MTSKDYLAKYARKPPSGERSKAPEGQGKPKGKKATPAVKWKSSDLKPEGIRLNIKPLSVNGAWKGRRFKSDKYKQYEAIVLMMLPKIEIPEPPYKLSLVFGFSNPAADLDNPAKCLIDILQKAYGFNDKHIFELNIRKEITEVNQEFITFKIATV